MEDLQSQAPDLEGLTSGSHPALTASPVSEEAPIRALLGSYRYSGGVAEQGVLWNKIEGTARLFNFLARGTVRKRLVASTQIAKVIRIEADSETLVLFFDETHQSAPLDGSSVKFMGLTSGGELVDMSFRVVPHTIEQTLLGDGKSRVNTYQLRGDTLVVHVSIKAAQIPKELAYDLTYLRTSEPTRILAGEAPTNSL